MEGDISRSYRILDLEPGASLSEVKQAYRILVKVWHPDRFANDSVMQANAQERLKKINSAYELIRKNINNQASNKNPPPGTSAPETKNSPESQYSRQKSAQQSSPNHGGFSEDSPHRTQSVPAKKRSGKSRFIKVLLAVVGFAFVKAMFSYSGNSSNNKDFLPVKPPAVSIYQPLNSQVDELLKTTPQLQQATESPEFSDAEQATTDSLGTSVRVESDENTSRPNPSLPPKAIPVAEAELTPSIARKAIPVNSASSLQGHGYFTIGSTKAEVLAAQGTPTKVSENEFNYEYSRVSFRNGTVVAWNDISKVLKTKMLPEANVQTRGYFTVGSTKDEVLAVQGTPTQVSENQFNYQYSSVSFRSGRVVAWHDISKVLKTKMLPEANVQTRGYFTVGSTKDDVLAVQGTPTQVSENEFNYQYSSVSFRSGRVVAWNDISKVLKTR